MKSITLGLAMGLIGAAVGSAALAQTPPAAPKPPAPAAQPAPAQPAPPAPPPAAPQTQQQAGGGGPGQPAMPTPSGPPEGMIVETPNGFFLVRPGDPNPRRLDLAGGAPMAQPGGPGGQPGEEAMDAPGDDGLQPPPPPHGPRGRPMPPRPPEGKGARFNIKTPNLTLGMKCPDDEPVKACVDAVSQLIDKAAAPGPQAR